MSHDAYRSEYQHVVRARIAEVETTREQVKPYLPGLRSIRSGRIARAVAGGVGIACMLMTSILGFSDLRAELTYLFLGSTGMMLATYVLSRSALAILDRFLPHESENANAARIVGASELSGNLEADLARIDATNPLPAIDQKLSRLETWSTALPLAALSLLMPLTLHWIFSVAMGESAASYSSWIRISLVVVGHAHLALLFMAIKFAQKMKRSSLFELREMSIHREWAKAWGVAIGVSCVPFILLFAVPPILVAITGFVFIPLMFILMRHRLLAERSALAEAETAASVHIRIADVEEPMRFGDASWADMMNKPNEAQRSEAFESAEGRGDVHLQTSMNQPNAAVIEAAAAEQEVELKKMHAFEPN